MTASHAADVYLLGVVTLCASRYVVPERLSSLGRFHGAGPLIRRWLPLASSIVITVLGVGIALHAVTAAGTLQVRF